MPAVKTITISLPAPMGRAIQKAAREEGRTVSELLRESFRQYDARRQFRKLALRGQRNAQRLGLTPEDFGGPFDD